MFPFPLPAVARLLALVPVVLLAACGDDPAAPDPPEPVPSALQFSALPPLQVTVGGTARLEVRVLDQMGRPMPGDTARLVSRDTTTLTVDSAGDLSGVAGGETWVVADVGTLRDSLPVSVRYPVLPGEARMRVVENGTSREEGLGSSQAVSLDILGSESRDWTLALFLDGSLFSSQTLGLLLLRDVREGEHALSPLEPEELRGDLLDLPTPVATIETVDDQDHHRLYVPLQGSRLTLDEARLGEEWGEAGRLDGRLVLRALAYEVITLSFEEPTIVPTGDTAMIYMDFSVEPVLTPLGQASYTLDGGPSEGTYTEQDAEWESWRTPGGRIWVGSGRPDVRIDLEELRGDTLTIQPSGPGMHGGDGTMVEAHAGDGVTGYARGGTVVVDRIIQPSADGWGEIAGTLEADLTYWAAYGTEVVDSARISLEFHVALPPLQDRALGPSSVSPAERDRFLLGRRWLRR